MVNTEKLNTETPITSETAASDMPSKGLNSSVICSIDTEKMNEDTQMEPSGTLIDQDSDNTTNKDSVNAENSTVNTETNVANLEKEYNDKETNRQNEAGPSVNTDNDTGTEVPISQHVNTLNMSETEPKEMVTVHQKSNGNDFALA